MAKVKKRMGKPNCGASLTSMYYDMHGDSRMSDPFIADDFLMWRERKLEKSFIVYRKPKKLKAIKNNSNE